MGGIYYLDIHKFKWESQENYARRRCNWLIDSAHVKFIGRSAYVATHPWLFIKSDRVQQISPKIPVKYSWVQRNSEQMSYENYVAIIFLFYLQIH